MVGNEVVFGAIQAGEPGLPAEGTDRAWLRELNLNPKYRVMVEAWKRLPLRSSVRSGSGSRPIAPAAVRCGGMAGLGEPLERAARERLISGAAIAVYAGSFLSMIWMYAHDSAREREPADPTGLDGIGWLVLVFVVPLLVGFGVGRYWALALLVFLTLVWGINWPVMKVGVTGFPPLTFRTLSMWLGLPVLGLALVVRLVRYIAIPRHSKLPCSRRGVLARDRETCQYCGTTRRDLTIDHVMPRSRGGKDKWDNVVVACLRCNVTKGSRTPKEAGFTLNKQPCRPFNFIHFELSKQHHVSKLEYDQWQKYLYDYS